MCVGTRESLYLIILPGTVRPVLASNSHTLTQSHNQVTGAVWANFKIFPSSIRGGLKVRKEGKVFSQRLRVKSIAARGCSCNWSWVKLRSSWRQGHLSLPTETRCDRSQSWPIVTNRSQLGVKISSDQTASRHTSLERHDIVPCGRLASLSSS